MASENTAVFILGAKEVNYSVDEFVGYKGGHIMTYQKMIEVLGELNETTYYTPRRIRGRLAQKISRYNLYR
jgi:hypothetical protein